MIIVLDKTESVEMAQEYIRHIGADDIANCTFQHIFWQTDLDHDDMKYKIDVYVR